MGWVQQCVFGFLQITETSRADAPILRQLAQSQMRQGKLDKSISVSGND